LQNDGIYRRELLGALRELVNVQMVNAQALIDLNKLIGGALNGKKSDWELQEEERRKTLRHREINKKQTIR